MTSEYDAEHFDIGERQGSTEEQSSYIWYVHLEDRTDFLRTWFWKQSEAGMLTQLLGGDGPIF